MQAHSWEPSLISLAYEAVNSVVPSRGEVQYDRDKLKRAYDHAASLTSTNSRSFYLASALLPANKRRAVRALYAFCRICDDIVDGCDGRRKPSWRNGASGRCQRFPSADDPAAVAWADTRRTFRIPQRYAEQLIDGVARDLYQMRYETFEDLTTYSYGVASTVGLMSMHIIGFVPAPRRSPTRSSLA